MRIFVGNLNPNQIHEHQDLPFGDCALLLAF